MADLNLPFGPWRKIVTAEWNDRPLSVYINNESLLLLTVFDKAEDGSIRGMLLLLKKPLLVDGRTDIFSSAQKRELVFIEKRSPDYHVQFMLLESTPYYVPYTQSELVQALSRQHTEISGTTRLLIDAASAYDVTLRELSKMDAKAMDLLLGDPFMLFSLSGAPQYGASARSSPKAARLKLGTDSQNAEFEVHAASLENVHVIGAEKTERLRALHILSEASLASGLPVLVFDAEKTFAGLSVPSADKAGLSTAGLEPLSAPFPFKAYALGKGLMIDLKGIDLDWFESLMGVKNKEIHPALESVFSESSSLDDLAQRLSELRENKAVPQSAIAKAVRAVRVLQKAYPATFGKNTFAELSAPWETGVAKTYYVDASGLPDGLKELLLLSTLSNLKDVPPLSLLFTASLPAENLSTHVKTVLAKKTGLCIALQGSHEADFEPLPSPTLQVDLLNDSAIATEPHKEKKRFRFRPVLTTFSTTGLTAV